MHIEESLDFFHKGLCHKLLSAWTRYFILDFDNNLILNNDTIQEASQIVELFNNLQKNRRIPLWDSKEYVKLLYSEESFEKYFTKKECVNVDFSFPDISEIKADFIDLKIEKGGLKRLKKKKRTYPKIVDFEREAAKRKRIGDLGEEIVLKKEQEILEQNGRKDLSEQVKQISKIDVSAGYDILSYNLKGEEKYIEVKSTTRRPSKIIIFVITINEYEKAKILDNHFLYVVFEVTSKNPKIWKLENPFIKVNKGMSLIPASYKVIIRISGSSN